MCTLGLKERQAQGIVLAKEKGKFKGGKPKFSESDPRLQLAFQIEFLILKIVDLLKHHLKAQRTHNPLKSI